VIHLSMWTPLSNSTGSSKNATANREQVRGAAAVINYQDPTENQPIVFTKPASDIELSSPALSSITAPVVKKTPLPSAISKASTPKASNAALVAAAAPTKHECTICGKVLKDAQALKKHVKIHGEKKWVCLFPDCGMKFLDLCKLKRHQSGRGHTDEAIAKELDRRGVVKKDVKAEESNGQDDSTVKMELVAIKEEQLGSAAGAIPASNPKEEDEEDEEDDEDEDELEEENAPAGDVTMTEAPSHVNQESEDDDDEDDENMDDE
jgi:hypothetical protein